MMELIIPALLASVVVAFVAGLTTYAWLYERVRTGVAEERQRAYRDAYIEAQKKIGDDLRKQQETLEKFQEFPKDGVEDMQTYEQSLKNLRIPQEKIDKLLAERRKM